MDCVVVRYGELALKKGNRGRFEAALMRNIRELLRSKGIECRGVRKVSGRVIVESSDARAAAVAASVFGVTSASPAVKVKPDVKSLGEAACRMFAEAEPKPKSFRISANRLEKAGEHKSQDINTIVGSQVVEKSGCRVSLGAPDLDISFDITAREAYAYSERIDGPGGLPVGASGKVAVLLSGGIDSPVAAWLCMRRGLEVTLLHFQHEDQVREPPAKLAAIAGRLGGYWPGIKLACIPVSALEKSIIMNVPADYRIVVLRRLFHRLAGRFARENRLGAVATGDNVGQVASQTIGNMAVISRAAEALWLRPLECWNKQEVVDLAKRIGTYELSIGCYVDCCSFLVAKHPSTKADPSKAERYEAAIPKEVLDEAYEGLFWAK